MAKKKAGKPAGVGSIFDHFGMQEEPEQDAGPQERGQADVLASIQERLAAMEAENRTLRELAMRPSAPAPVQAPVQAPTQVDFNGLPDPVTDMPGYQRELQARVNAALQGATAAVEQRVTSARSEEDQASALWTSFASRYPEWAEHEDLVGTIAQKTVAEAQRKGLDTQKYVFQNSDLFFSDVEKQLKSKYGRLVTQEEEDEGEDERDDERAADLIEDDGRSAGIFGGQETGGKPAVGGKQAKMAEGDMVRDLHDLQRRSGFF